ncbi:hypothetical protein C7212DRAFT_347644 [Tuber magnatum]|uniref:Uncharacterized protein n=1 Tax=Tuber magnatum TaxID=42249 RepID=A0A317SHW6_9PEZI|nr:hypothetical protein C7212DRAFT_347644 [Tuber magnatum]
MEFDLLTVVSSNREEGVEGGILGTSIFIVAEGDIKLSRVDRKNEELLKKGQVAVSKSNTGYKTVAVQLQPHYGCDLRIALETTIRLEFSVAASGAAKKRRASAKGERDSSRHDLDGHDMELLLGCELLWTSRGSPHRNRSSRVDSAGPVRETDRSGWAKATPLESKPAGIKPGLPQATTPGVVGDQCIAFGVREKLDVRHLCSMSNVLYAWVFRGFTGWVGGCSAVAY